MRSLLETNATDRQHMQSLKGIFLSAALLLILNIGVWAQTPHNALYRFDKEKQVFRIDADSVTYAFGVNEQGGLQSIYWGGRLADSDVAEAAHSSPGIAFDLSANTTLQEFTGWGAGVYTEPALKVRFSDGNRDLVLRYVSHTVSADELIVKLKNISRDVRIDLHYKMDAQTGVLARSATIHNGSQASIVIDQAAAGNLNLPRGDEYRLHYLSGGWGGEFTPQARDIVPGKTVLESRSGSTGHQDNPWFAIERSPVADQEHGAVWFGALAWSGSWAIDIEQDTVHQVRVTSGFNPFDFGYKLDPGAVLDTPVLYAGFTNDGLGGAARLMHRFDRRMCCPSNPRLVFAPCCTTLGKQPI